MNRNDFLRVIETSGPSDRQTIGEISELISIFPYFQSAYMLMLRGLQNTGDVKFENQLRTTAMHIADREVLYYFLKKETVQKEEIKPSVPGGKTPDTETADTQQVVIETARNSEELINEIEKSSGEGISGETVMESGEEISHPVMITSETEDDGSNATVLIIDEESGSVEEKVIYMDPGFSISEHPDLLELDIEMKVTSVAAEESVADSVESGGDEVSTRQIQSDLIDKFILANPRIEPRKEKSDAPVEDISKPFVEEKGEFVTETLARIYVKQGYYSKAIDIYEKLSLKFPEKSSYFAAFIEKVKDLIK